MGPKLGGKKRNINRFGRQHKQGIQQITKGDIRRLARRGGVKRIAHETYDATRESVFNFLQIILRDSLVFAEHSRRKTICVIDVVLALKRNGKTLLGFV